MSTGSRSARPSRRSRSRRSRLPTSRCSPPGKLLAGRIVSFDGSTLAFDDSGGRRTLAIGQVLALTFCDAPCSVGAVRSAHPVVPGGRLRAVADPLRRHRLRHIPVADIPARCCRGATITTTFGPSPMSGAAGSPGAPDTCHGDEQISFSPTEPRVGDELLIAVTSARPVR